MRTYFLQQLSLNADVNVCYPVRHTPVRTQVRYLCWVTRTAAAAGDDSSSWATSDSLPRLLMETATTAASPGAAPTGAAAAAVRPTPTPLGSTSESPNLPAPGGDDGGGGGGGGVGGQRQEVLRLWRKPAEDLSLEEMEW